MFEIVTMIVIVMSLVSIQRLKGFMWLKGVYTVKQNVRPIRVYSKQSSVHKNHFHLLVSL